MDNRVLGGIGAVIVALLVWNTATLSSLNGRVAALETVPAQPAEQASAHMRPERSGRHGDADGRREGRRQGKHGPRSSTKGDAHGLGSGSSNIFEDMGSPDKKGAIDFDDPAVREELETLMEQANRKRRQERHKASSEAWLDSMNDEVSTFADERGLSDDTTEELRLLLTERHTTWRTVHDDARSGSVSWIDARKEMSEAREDSESKLRELLGDDDFAVLDEKIFGDQGRRH